jgi:phospholipid N-methyltransferase
MNPSIYTRPNKPKTMTVTRRTEAPAMAFPEIAAPIELHSSTECHVTPPEVAARMVDYLTDAQGDFLTLEPEAGTGALLEALFNVGHSRLETVAIERDVSLCKAIRQRFKGNQYIEPINECFLAYAANAVGKIEYPRIIMNPPFRYVKKHMDAALSLLGRGGHDRPAVLVALVPITYEHEDARTMEILPNTTFSSAAVNTKIIRIER